MVRRVEPLQAVLVGPNGAAVASWDLALGMVRDDLAQADVVVLERQFPGLAARLATAEQPSADDETAGVQPPHLALDTGEPVDNVPHEVRQLHPAPGTGCNQRANEVQLAQLRGAMVAPEPYKEPSRKPPAAPAHAPEAPHLGVAGGGRAVGEFFAVLGDGWRLTAAQRARLAPAVQAALDAGWLPQALAAFTGANTTGVRILYAVLAARLSPAELPPPHGQRPARPPWCGQCDEVTRMLGFDGDAPRPCPRCKPSAATSRAAPAESAHAQTRCAPLTVGARRYP